MNMIKDDLIGRLGDEIGKELKKIIEELEGIRKIIMKNVLRKE